jgi:hypothetical protein
MLQAQASFRGVLAGVHLALDSGRRLDVTATVTNGARPR